MSITDDKTLFKRQYIDGVDIFSPGGTAEEAFLIEKGSVGIYRDSAEDSKEIAILGEGDIFGEMALLQNSTHKSRATALDKTNLVIITKKSLKDKLKDTDPLITALVHMFVKRLYLSNEKHHPTEGNDSEE